MIRLFALAALLVVTSPLEAASPLLKAPPGFRVELLLEAPAIEAPTALCVASNGDVYFAEDPMDMAGPPTKNLDKIWLLKGGDPKRKILFADRMWAVMGMEIVRDKLYVVHAPHVTVFTLDAEGKAKERKELFDDLGPKVAGLPSFNDHIPSGIRMGMDGWLYISIGDKGIPKMARKETDQGSVHVAEGRWRHSKEGHHISLEGGGVIRFRPDGSGLEVFACGTRNHLDVPMDEHDRIFVRDNTDDGLGWWTRLMYLPPGAFMGYPWAYTRRPKECLPMIRDFGGGSPCGGWVYLDDGLPQTYRGRIFHCEWGQGKVWAVKVAPDGGGFKFVDPIAFLEPGAVKDFRPFTLRPKADGRGFYVTDWGYSGWSVKAKAGRLWKVTYTGNDVQPMPRGKDTDSMEQLIQSLDHPAHSERLRAQRQLTARTWRAAKTLEKAWFEKKLTPRAKAHALWVLAETNSPKWEEPAFAYLSDEKNRDLRLEAVRVLGSSHDTEIVYESPPQESEKDEGKAKKKAVFRWLLEWGKVESRLLALAESDPDPQVRMQAVLALGAMNTECEEKSASILARPQLELLAPRLGKEEDRWVRSALVRVLKRAEVWQFPDFRRRIPEILKSNQEQGLDGLLWLLVDEYQLSVVEIIRDLRKQNDPSVRRRAVETLARMYKDRKPYAGGWWGTQPASQKPPPREVEWEGTARVREAILGALADKDAGVRKAAVTALIAMSDPQTLRPLIGQFEKEKDAAARVDLMRAIATLPDTKTVDFLIGVLKDGNHPDALRLEAIAGLEKSKTPAALASLATSAAPSEPVAVQIRALEALGQTKAPQAKKVCAISLQCAELSVRKTAAKTLAQLNDAASAGLLLPLLKDKETSVRSAAIQTLGTLKAKDAIPQLIQASGESATQFEAITALARMPDKRALSAYLTGLESKNVELRQACRRAIAALGNDAIPTLEKLAKGNEISAAALAELREVYSSFTPILAWRIIGPFPRDGKAHPPQREQQFNAVYKGAEKDVKWQTVQAEAGQHGRVNLGERLQPNQQVVAYGYAEIDSATARDAVLLCGSDDTLTIWLNDKKIHDFQGDRGWAPNQDKVKIHLEKGKNRLLIACANSGGPWDFSIAVSGDGGRFAFLKNAGKKFDPEAFRVFARQHKGDAERGRKLFLDTKGLACVKCHAIGGAGGQVGPDLAGIALRYPREELMTAILEPSKVIAQGYETIVIETKKGQALTGVFKGENGDAVNFADAEGKTHRVPKKDIEERSFSPVSTMPNGLSDGMTLQDFTDLVAFLEARREDKAPEKGGEIEGILREALKAWGAPGIAAAVVRDDEIIYLGGVGVRELGGGKRVTKDTLFPIGSCTKAFTATALAILVDRGKADWDDPVRKHLPWFRLADPLADRDVRLRDLLCHRIGLAAHDLLWYRAPWSIEESVRRMAFLPRSSSFRSRYEYNNLAYLAAGLAISQTAKQPWYDFVRNEIFRPLGMNHVVFTSGEAQKAADHASPHGRSAEGKVAVIPWYTDDKQIRASGSIKANVADLSRWLRFQLAADGKHGERQLLSDAALAETHAPQIVVPLTAAARAAGATQASYGLGWLIHDYRGHLIHEHGGAVAGFRARIVLVPKKKLGFMLLTNLEEMEIVTATGNNLLDHLLGLEKKNWHALIKAERKPSAKSRLRRVAGTKPSLEWDAYTGTYHDPAYGTVMIARKGDALELSWSSFQRVPLTHFHYDTFMLQSKERGPAHLLAEEPVVFEMNQNAEIADLRFLGRKFTRVKANK